MTASECDAIIGGYHGDPFAILGPHQIDLPPASPESKSFFKRNGAELNGGSKPTWEIRAFLPQARSASVATSGESIAMEKTHSQGFFTATLDHDPGSYHFEIEGWYGGKSEVEDPYRFPPLLTPFDLHLTAEGTLFEGWHTFGAHLVTVNDVAGVRFAVWAPNAEAVSVTGDFNEWDSRRHPMRARESGVWELFVPGAKEGESYKYHVRSRFAGYQQLKADPYGFASEVPPKSASVVFDLSRYEWKDAEWMRARGEKNWLQEPISIYEVHLESWMRGPSLDGKAGEPLTYREFSVKLVEYVKRLGYTHIELMPIQEHPFSGSWGYQVTGYFTPTSRFGSPAEFMHFIDACHAAEIGVILDWVPAHFPRDAHGLAWFDGTALYEHADPRQGQHLEWGTLVFNYGRTEVCEFLISSALFWLKQYHIDGLRVDAVASMLYLDYSRKEGEWLPNIHGGRENLEAIAFLRRFNQLAHEVPGVFTIAEESTAFPGVSHPVYAGGLGFTMKWNMGWMHDMLHYFSENPVYRKYQHNNITFSLLYAFTENFVLPISHDELVYGKRSLLNKMPGDQWQQFANVRAFLAFMFLHPGKKLLFMGTEIGDYEEWNNAGSLPWEVLEFPLHASLQLFVQELNRFYRAQPALWQVDFAWNGFEWIDFGDVENSVITFLRRGRNPDDFIVAACNFTPVPRLSYDVGVPEAGFYEEVLNSDAGYFGGGNMGNNGGVHSLNGKRHGRAFHLTITLPPLAVVAFRLRRESSGAF